jgi:hypothetical protein
MISLNFFREWYMRYDVCKQIADFCSSNQRALFSRASSSLRRRAARCRATHWSMRIHACMVYGVWCMVYGVWCMVWCMVYGEHSVWCMVYSGCSV